MNRITDSFAIMSFVKLIVAILFFTIALIIYPIALIQKGLGKILTNLEHINFK